MRKQMHRKRVNEEVEMNASPKVLRKDHVYNPTHSIRGGKSLAAIGLDAGSTFSTPDAQDDSTTAKSVSYPNPLSYWKPSTKPLTHEMPRWQSVCSHFDPTDENKDPMIARIEGPRFRDQGGACAEI
ncbi:hypothetical protein Tco_0557244 [Tanacetum coccineum]